MSFKPLKVGDVGNFTGCFTHEEWITGKNAHQIATELGLPPHRMADGIFVVWAEVLPSASQFHLGGYAKFATNNFISYGKNGDAIWSEKDFENTYKDGGRMSISIDEAKRAWMSEMRRSKLVKVISVVPGASTDVYPPGNKAPQIIVNTPIRCQIAKFLKPHETFRGIWS
jgi:hypothetical protein